MGCVEVGAMETRLRTREMHAAHRSVTRRTPRVPSIHILRGERRDVTVERAVLWEVVRRVHTRTASVLRVGVGRPSITRLASDCASLTEPKTTLSNIARLCAVPAVAPPTICSRRDASRGYLGGAIRETTRYCGIEYHVIIWPYGATTGLLPFPATFHQ